MTQTNKTRLNTDIRKKIGGLILSHFENEKTTEYENFVSAKEDIDTAYAVSISSFADTKFSYSVVFSFSK